MKNLLLLTSHRQLKEIEYYAKFLKNCKNLKDWHLLLMVNNLDLDLNFLKKTLRLIPLEKKDLIITSINCGYNFGVFELISSQYEYLKKYDNVFHMGTDVFIVDDQKFSQIVNLATDKKFVLNYIFGNDHPFPAVDLFLYRPKILNQNIFNGWENETTNIEEFFLKQIQKYNIEYFIHKRFDNDVWVPRRLDMWGCWHEHDLCKIEIFLKKNGY